MLSAKFLQGLAERPGIPSVSRRKLLATASNMHVMLRPDLTRPLAGMGPSRIDVHDCESLEVLPGKLVSEPSASSDSVLRRGSELTGEFRRFLQVVMGRESLDESGMPFRCCMHYSRSYCNAFWDSGRAVFGDGDGLIFKPFVSSDDFVAHEFTHGVTEFTAGLAYEDEAGALNESMSDVFGVTFRQWRGDQQLQNADWRIAADMMGPTAIELGWDCLRHVADPGISSSMTRQPRSYSQYVKGGEPHVNSGIPNRAFYLAVAGTQRPSWEVGAKVWYTALTTGNIGRKATLADFASATVQTAKQLFAAQPAIAAAIQEAWAAVEVNVMRGR